MGLFVSSQFNYTRKDRIYAFFIDEILNFQGATPSKGVGSFSYLQSKQSYIRQNVRTASIPRLSRAIIEKIQIALPSIEEQKRIVSILDRFDKFCNDINTGLPAEIEARQKQYEYYRDKLLSFKELK